MPWVEVLTVFLVCHVVGDFLLQTDFEATHKHGGLGSDAEERHALLKHVFSYTACFVPAVIWLWPDLGAWALLILPAVALPHVIQDDGRLVKAWVRKVKGPTGMDTPWLYMQVDQSFHLLALFATALVVHAAS